MAAQILEQVCEHLSFLGYEIEPTDEDDKRIARHKNKMNILVEAAEEAVTFYSFFSANGTAAKDNAGYLEFINSLNMAAAVTQFSKNPKNALVMHSCFMGKYDKAAFGRFIQLREHETGYLLKEMYSKVPDYLG